MLRDSAAGFSGFWVVGWAAVMVPVGAAALGSLVAELTRSGARGDRSLLVWIPAAPGAAGAAKL
ncbi:hypothetical protein HMPREF0742_01280 [Rothia aeria F0184]|uniref:Uncharacterized protein n=1 Tax=Rothia aeria F0184 TaxID=888019 RepID=U7V3G6_9MICC|nr:hypothetical protein HMPREF0742_01280 [Rothia aeria F0184]